jgi:hypothetical protein
MSSALLSVLLVCNRKILRHRRKFSNILIGPNVRHFSDGNQTVYPTLKKLIMASHYAKTTGTMFIQLARLLLDLILFECPENFAADHYYDDVYQVVRKTVELFGERGSVKKCSRYIMQGQLQKQLHHLSRNIRKQIKRQVKTYVLLFTAYFH